MRGGGVAENFIISRPHEAGELLDDLKIGIRAPLADLVREDGDVDGVERVTIIAAEPAGVAAQIAVTEADELGVLRAAKNLRRIGPAGSGGIEAAIVIQIIRGGPLRREARVIARLVARRKQNE